MATSAFAAPREYIDKNFDFSKPRRIYINFHADKDVHPIIVRESRMAFEEIVFGKVLPAMRKKGFTFENKIDFANRLKMEKNIDFWEIERNDPQEAKNIENQYIWDNFDLLWDVFLYSQGTDMVYREGFSFDVPSQENTYYSGTAMYNNGGYAVYSGVVTKNTTKKINVDGRDVTQPYCYLKLYLYDLNNSGTNVWYVDDFRQRTNNLVIQNTTSMDLYKRALNSFIGKMKSNFKF